MITDELKSNQKDDSGGTSFKTMIIVLISLLGIIYLFKACGDYTPPKEDNFTEYVAGLYAEEYVKKNLKSPASAEFPIHKTVRINENSFLVDSYVDSQNGFGAMIRTYFRCEIVRRNDNIYIENFTFK